MQWNHGFDFGADTVRMVSASESEIYTEAPYAAYRQDEDTPFAMGDRAYGFYGREMGRVSVRKCFEGGVPSDTDLAARWISRLLRRENILRRRRVLIGISPELSPGIREKLLKDVLDAGMDAAGTVNLDAAALLGSGGDVFASETEFILDIGASRMRMSAFAGGHRVKTATLSYGMNRADTAIIQRVREEYGVNISARTARLIKHAAFDTAARLGKLPVFDPSLGFPKEMTIDPAVARESLNDIITGILSLAAGVLTDLDPASCGDLIKNGIVLTGGGSCLTGMDVCLSEALGVKAIAAEAPREAAARGIKLILSNPELYSPFITDWREAGMGL